MPILRKNGINLQAPVIANAKPKTTLKPVAANDEGDYVAPKKITLLDVTLTVFAALIISLLLIYGIEQGVFWWVLQGGK